MQKPQPKTRVVTAWVRPIYCKDGRLYAALCAEDKATGELKKEMRTKSVHISVAEDVFASLSGHASFSVCYRVEFETQVPDGRLFNVHGTIRKARPISRGCLCPAVNLLRIMNFWVVQTERRFQLTSWLNLLPQSARDPAARVKRGRKPGEAFNLLVTANARCRPMSGAELAVASFGSPARYDLLCTVVLRCERRDAALKLAFSPDGNSWLCCNAALALLEHLPKNGPAVRQAMQEVANLHEPPLQPGNWGFFAKYLASSRSVCDLDAPGWATGDAQVDKQRGLLLQWASPSATAHAPWTGKLRDAPPGLVKTAYAGGRASSFYLLDRQHCATGSGNATTVRVTLVYSPGARGAGCIDASVAPTTLAGTIACSCLSATADGAPCAVPLKYAALIPALMRTAVVDAALEPWADRDLVSLLSCFQSVHVLHASASDVASRLLRLCGQTALKPVRLEPPTKAAPQPQQLVEEEEDSLSAGFEFAVLTEEEKRFFAERAAEEARRQAEWEAELSAVK